jgi:hypothetical protein
MFSKSKEIDARLQRLETDVADLKITYAETVGGLLERVQALEVPKVRPTHFTGRAPEVKHATTPAKGSQ